MVDTYEVNIFFINGEYTSIKNLSEKESNYIMYSLKDALEKNARLIYFKDQDILIKRDVVDILVVRRWRESSQ